jgi:hypothetical protein
MNGRERQNNQVHHQKNCNPEKQTANHRMLNHESQLPASQIENKSSRHGDKKMKENSHNVSA